MSKSVESFAEDVLELLAPHSSQDLGDVDDGLAATRHLLAAAQAAVKAERAARKRDKAAGLPLEPERVRHAIARLRDELGDLRDEARDAARETRLAKQRARPLEKRLKALMKAAGKKQSAARGMLRGMASIHLNRVGCPRPVANLVNGACPASDDLLLAVSTWQAPHEVFDELFVTLRDAEYPDGPPPGADWWAWVCTPAAAALPERHMLGMCPGGKPHYTEAQLAEAGNNHLGCVCDACRCRKAAVQAQEAVPPVRHELAAERNKIARLRGSERQLRARVGALENFKERGFFETLLQGGPVRDDDPVLHCVGAREVLAGVGVPAEASSPDEVHCRALAQWEALRGAVCGRAGGQLPPLRIVFVDKSASMGTDRTTLDALHVATHNGLNPPDGRVTLLFLVAGPGETQMYVRNGSEPCGGATDVESVLVALGSSTWFNEPVVECLATLAGVLEQRQLQHGADGGGRHPLEVICVTDGRDNQSPPDLQEVPGFVDALRSIEGPQTRLPLFDVVAPGGRLAEPTGDALAPVPLLLCWVALGGGGGALLADVARRAPGGPGPAPVLHFDACVQAEWVDGPVDLNDFDLSLPHLPLALTAAPNPSALGSTAASRARQRGPRPELLASVARQVAQLSKDAGGDRFAPGHRIRVRQGSGRPPRAAVVLRVNRVPQVTPQDHGVRVDSVAATYHVLFDDDGTEDAIAPASIAGFADGPSQSVSLLLGARRMRQSTSGDADGPVLGPAARQRDREQARVQAVALVDALTTHGLEAFFPEAYAQQMGDGSSTDASDEDEAGGLSRSSRSSRPKKRLSGSQKHGVKRGGKQLPPPPGGVEAVGSTHVCSLEGAVAVLEKKRLLPGAAEVAQKVKQQAEATTMCVARRRRAPPKKAVGEGASSDGSDDDAGEDDTPCEAEEGAGAAASEVAGHFKAVLREVGKGVRNMTPELRVPAQRFVSVALEVLVCGGCVGYDGTGAAAHALLWDQFRFVVEAAHRPRGVVTDAAIEEWQATVVYPLRRVFDTLRARKLVQGTLRGAYSLSVPDDAARAAVLSLWRFFDPSLAKVGDDALRRAANYLTHAQDRRPFAGVLHPSQTPPKRGSAPLAAEEAAAE
eukprot:TRINITY_DN10798_c0_g1_i3.p1 TRINITY_DN10798_c0_g1~~TRINITY_DN10798_c0_g1_i3.p1  ORF type:complete len:1104 (+),score=320.05 TRINITY_DN10798_c0_g1_i3:67-3378(+)